MCLKKCRHVFKILDIKIFIKNVNDVTKNHLISIKNVSCVHKFVHKMWYNILEKWRSFFTKNICQVLHKKLTLGTRKMENEYAVICLFHERWIKNFYTQPFGQLYIKYGLVFQKFYLVQFCNKYMVGSSQKNSFWALKKQKIAFLSKENKNSIRNIVRHCNMHPCALYEII